MSESLTIKDAYGQYRNIQVSSVGDNYVTNQTVISAVQSASVTKYYSNGPNGWNWETPVTGVAVAQQDNNRLGLIINNNTTDLEFGNCYIIVGNNSFGTITDKAAPPPLYSFLLEPGGIYISDHTTTALKHSIYVPSSSFIASSGSMSVLVTLIT